MNRFERSCATRCRHGRAFVLAIVLLSGSTIAPAGAQETSDARVVPIQVTGDPAKRFSLVILGDGYTAAEQPRFREHVEKHLNILWSLEPFRSYRNHVNVYAVEIDSPESGVTCDPAHREQRRTPMSLVFAGGCDDPNARGINVDQEAARRYARMATPDYDQILTIANTDTYGGIGGATATTSGGNALGPYITPHELGHSLGRLQDEYTYSRRGVAGGVYTGDEPASIHHTRLTEDAMRGQQQKWWRWLGEASEAGGVIGRYEGGQSQVSGIWRPSRHSMMISLGYYFDQVSRERLTQRISGQVELISASTPVDARVSPRSVIWIETAHPVFHDLDVTWQVDGRPIDAAAGRYNLELRSLGLGSGAHTITVKVVDPTDFVRDPVIRDTSFTATRQWTVGDAPLSASTTRAAFTASTQTARPVAGTEVVYVETTHPPDRIPTVTWQLDGQLVADATSRRSLALGDRNLAAGTHRLSATVADASIAGAGTQVLEWIVDNTRPTVAYTLTEPIASIGRSDGARHYWLRDRFTMTLEPADDQPGYVVAEFRVNGDGWHHYYGWPDAPPGTPFLFSPRGTTIKELIYGSLSAEGLSPQPWETREPGWGTHVIEYRARDAAGNIGSESAFHVTLAPSPDCTSMITGMHIGDLTVEAGVTCIAGAYVSGNVVVGRGASLIATSTTIRGSVTTNEAATVEIVGTIVTGALRLVGTTSAVTVFGSSIDRDVVLVGNRTVPVLAGNRIGGILECGDNSGRPGDLDAPNSAAGGASGQCAAR